MKDKLLKLLKSKEEARALLVAKSEKSEDIGELRSIQTQMDSLNFELVEVRSLLADIETQERVATEADAGQARTAAVTAPVTSVAPAAEARAFVPGKGFNPVTEGTPGALEDRAKASKAELEKRGVELKEGRSVTVGTSSIVLPQQTATTINPTFQLVSGLIDRVDRMVLNGGESFSQPYEKDTPAGDYTAEGIAAVDADVVFGYADIAKTKVTSYSEITNEVRKLPAADYESVVMAGISKSARRKLTKEILLGTGGAGHLTGIFSANATAIDPALDLGISAIDNTTLDSIMFSFGYDEAIEDQAVLILSKKDLAAFARLRTVSGEKFHTIVSNGNTGSIDGVAFIINSACAPVSVAGTASGSYSMAYGPMTNYKLVVFSDLDVQRSTDYKFKEGMIAHRGEIYAGGNVVAYNGFLRVKKS